MSYQQQGGEFIRIGPPVYRNPIDLGPVRPTVKQRLGPMNQHAFLRIGEAIQAYPYRGRSATYYSPRYTLNTKHRGHRGEHSWQGHISRNVGGHSSIHRGGSYASQNNNRYKYKSTSRPESRDHHHDRERSRSVHGETDPLPPDKQDALLEIDWKYKNSDQSSIVIQRDLLKGKRTVQYDATTSRKVDENDINKDKNSKDGKEPSGIDSKNDREKSKEKSDAQCKSKKTATDSKSEDSKQVIPATSESPELVIIESISGDSSTEEGEIEEEDVEVLQLRRQALEAMVKKLDESRRPDSNVASTNTEPGNNNASIDSSTCAPVSILTTNASDNLDTDNTDERTLREKLLVEISRKRKLNINDTAPSASSKTQADKTLTAIARPAASKHSPIKFPGGVVSHNSSSVQNKFKKVPTRAAKQIDLRETLRSKAKDGPSSSLPVKPEPLLYDFHEMGRQNRSHNGSRKSTNRAFDRKYRDGYDMGNIIITIANPAKPKPDDVIVPSDVSSTDEESCTSESEGEVMDKPLPKRDKEDNRWKGIRHDEHSTEPKHSQTRETTADPVNPGSSVISPDQLPDSFQRKLAKLLKEAKEDSRRSMEMDAEKEAEQRRKEKVLRDVENQARRIREEEEALRKEKEQLAYLKAERSRKLLQKARLAKSISSPKNVHSTNSSSTPEHAGSPTPSSSSPFDAKSSFQALKHLPIHKQVEYIRLQSKILEHEHKLSEARFSFGLSKAQEMSIKDTTVQIIKRRKVEVGQQGVASENADANGITSRQSSSSGGETLARSIQGADSKATEIAALFEREKILKAALMENMEISQNHLALKAKENELVNARKATCQAMSVLISAILKRSHSKLACRHLEEKITLLQYHLKVATDSLREEQCRLDASVSAIEHATKQTDDMKQQCQSLQDACVELGQKVKGTDYQLTSIGSDEIKKKQVEIERTSKVTTSPSLKKIKVLGSGMSKTPAQILRQKSLARALRSKQHYNWRKSSSSSPAFKKKRDSQSLDENTAMKNYFGDPGSAEEDENEILILPKRTFMNVLTKRVSAGFKKRRIGMSKFEEYVSPLRFVDGEDNGFLREQMTGMAVNKVHPAVIICSFELRGFCNSEACSLQHLYRPNNLS